MLCNIGYLALDSNVQSVSELLLNTVFNTLSCMQSLYINLILLIFVIFTFINSTLDPRKKLLRMSRSSIFRYTWIEIALN